MVWDGMTQEEQVTVISQTVINGEKDWVIWRIEPTQNKVGEQSG
jgi:hypothetical protein